MKNSNTYYWMKRRWMDDAIFPSVDKEPFCKRAAWAWLIDQAHWSDTPKEVNINGEIITLKRGELSHSIRYIAEAWGWSKSKTQRFIVVLADRAKIDTRIGTGQLIITLCKYEEIQDAVKKLGQVAGQQRDSSGTKNNTNNTNNTEEEYNTPEKDLLGESKYAWEGDVIKLSKKDFDAFQKNYYAIADLGSTLFSEDVFLSRDPEGRKRQPKWFMYLANRLKQVHNQSLPEYHKRKEKAHEAASAGFSSYDPAYAKPRPVN